MLKSCYHLSFLYFPRISACLLHWILQVVPDEERENFTKKSREIDVICCKFWFIFESLTFLGCFAACVVGFEVLFCFGSLYLTEVMAEEVLSKLRSTHKVYLRLVENSSKEVNDVLETFLPDGNFDTIIRLNTLKTSILNKIDKIKGLDEMKRTRKSSWIKFLLVKINTCTLYLKKIYIYRSHQKMLSQKSFPKTCLFKFLKQLKFVYQN